VSSDLAGRAAGGGRAAGSAKRATSRCEAWLGTGDDPWDAWVRAEIASELALYLWRTSPRAERAPAHEEYLVTLDDEELAAAALHRARTPERTAA
jgi:hypothetical protein